MQYAHAPLAERLRPTTLEEVLGQSRLLGPHSLLRQSLAKDTLPSMIFWGPPGCGKTSLAHVIRSTTKQKFVSLSAVSAGIKEVKDVIGEAKGMAHRQPDLLITTKRTILFIDEIHRFNKAQQDALLGAVEDGTITLIGATTENPGFEVNNALLSRCQLLLFAPLSKDDLAHLVISALHTHPRGLKRRDLEFSDEVIAKLVSQADGDARYLLNQVEWIVDALGAPIADQAAPRRIEPDDLDRINFHKPLRYDKNNEEHYNLISVLHKSVRGSDVHAALYWLHRMLQGGEDPKFILRRLMRMAMEDVGLADTHALVLARACQEAFTFMGVPEGLLALDQLTIYLSLAPKSNSVEVASMLADSIVKEHGTLPVPRAFRNPVNKTGRDLAYGHGYIYDHDVPGAYSGQEHLPTQIQGTKIYQPSEYGQEVHLAKRLEELEQRKGPKPT